MARKLMSIAARKRELSQAAETGKVFISHLFSMTRNTTLLKYLYPNRGFYNTIILEQSIAPASLRSTSTSIVKV